MPVLLRWTKARIPCLVLLALMATAGVVPIFKSGCEAQEASCAVRWAVRQDCQMKRRGTWGLLPLRGPGSRTWATRNVLQSRSRTDVKQPASVDPHPVLAIFEIQEKAWNEGDIEKFMEYYWKSDDLTFSSVGKVTRGWQNTLDHYRERYPTAEDMGETHFKNLEVFPLGDSAALVLGEFYLTRESGSLQGDFSVVFQKIDGRWVIIHDHTSRDPDEDSP